MEQWKSAGRPRIEDTLRAWFAVATRRQWAHRRLAPIDGLYNLVQTKMDRGGERRVLFQSPRFHPILLEARREYQTGLIASGFKDRLYAARRGMGYVPIDDLPPFVFHYFEDGNEDHLHDFHERMVAKLSRARPDYIVLWNDSLPVERGIILASRDLGITTINVQDGIYQEGQFTHGQAADHVFVWGRYFRRMYLKNGKRKGSQVHVLGYPFLLEREEDRERGRQKPTVAYLGQNLEAYLRDLLPIKVETIQAMHHISRALGFRFFYRPHPGDNREMLRKRLPDVLMTSPRESLAESIQRGTIFVSFNSTALIEAAMHGKMAIQLRNFPLQTDNFQDLGIVHRSLRTLEQLESYLVQLSRQEGALDLGFAFNQDYIEITGSPGARFIELLATLEAKA